MWIGLGIAALLVLGAMLPSGDSSAARGPSDEQAFVEIVQVGQAAAEDSNEVAIHRAAETRAKDLCALMPEKLAVTDWVGTIETVETTMGGDSGVLDVEIAEDVNLSTWSNAFSDLGDQTVIDPKSSLYDSLIDLEEGDQVTFSGRFFSDEEACLAEQSVFETSSMEHPTFVFRFTALQQD